MNIEFTEEFARLYKNFINSKCDRKAFIRNFLAENGVETSVIQIAGREHIHVIYPSSSYSPLFKMKTLIAHYDRAGASPGANDNSSSVISLMNFAIRLSRLKNAHNVRIFFTDGEELSEYIENESANDSAQLKKTAASEKSGSLVGKMGAFGLAALFKKLGITNDDVYVFDCTGRGTLPVLGETILPDKVSQDFAKRFYALESRAKKILNAVSPNFMTLPISYSDNAGFLICGIPAVVITMLPQDEATAYVNNLFKCRELKSFVTRHKIEFSEIKGENPEHKILKEFEVRDLIPATWKLFHSGKDSFETLTPESFEITAKILDAIAASRTMG